MLVYFFKHLPKIFLIGDYIIINLFLILGKLYVLNSDKGDLVQSYITQFILLNISWFVITTMTKPYKCLKMKESSLHFNALTKSFILLALFSAIYFCLILPVKINYRNVILYFLLIGFSIPIL